MKHSRPADMDEDVLGPEEAPEPARQPLSYKHAGILHRLQQRRDRVDARLNAQLHG